MRAGRGRSDAFTLVEMLVVALVLALLAAITIPILVSQRQEAWRASVMSDLRNAATEMEAVSVDLATYPPGELIEFAESPGVEIVVVLPPPSGMQFCLTGRHSRLPGVWMLSSTQGIVVEGDCS